ncbi:MAG: type IV toxin-antitoxin system AbiEi family antitoxin domain-containing protein [Candidatus Dojkabacteria bacterium]
MKYIDFKEKLEKLKVFSIQDISLIDENFRLPTLYEWEDKGLVRKIRNKWYVFNDFEPVDYDYYMIANRIVSPSYISLESALAHYSVIPESVQQIISITTLKTQSYDTEFGRFVYKSIKQPLFVGYKVLHTNGIGVKMASLEKALLDTLYLNSDITSLEDFDGLRYNRILLQEDLDQEMLQKYLRVFNSRSLEDRVATLLKYVFD